MPVHPKKWGGPCAIRQQSLSINLRSQGGCQGPGEQQICYCDRFTGAGPWPDASPSPPAPSPPCIPPCMARLLPYPCGTWLSDRALTLQVGPPALPSSLNTAAPALLLPVWLCIQRLVPVLAGTVQGLPADPSQGTACHRAGGEREPSPPVTAKAAETLPMAVSRQR